MKHTRKLVPALIALAVAVGLSACGSSDEKESTEVVGGQFALVPDAPSGYDSLSGEATLERSDGRTVIALDLEGLQPDNAYEAHLHSGGCDQADPGGPHFKFDPKGSEEPPNEIHLDFVSSGGGDGKARVTSKGEVPLGEAGSIVLHGAGDHTTSTDGGEAETVFVHAGHHHEEESAPVKIACADLEGDGGGAEPGNNPESASMGGKVPTIVIRNGEPVGGIKELEYDAGDEIRFEVTSDVADEVHVHGYDLMQDVPAGGTVSFDFPAEIEGIFEAELEGRKEQIAEIRVNP